jgi:lysophospholipid acyltransferase (LPLAT)-like uncharacterized protein
MKNFLFCFLLITVNLITHAQNAKPSKEEIVKFLNNEMQIGLGPDGPSVTTTFIEFKYDKYVIKFNQREGSKFMTLSYSNIPWDKIKSIASEINTARTACVTLYIHFERSVTKTVEGEKLEQKIEADTSIFFDIPKDKIESCKKAILRLAEIAKEENKDPFVN